LYDLRRTTGDHHEYIGTDIVEAFFPESPPPGVSLRIQSITNEWPEDLKNSFDYVHQRLTLAGAGQEPVQECVARLVGLLKPGGWVELVEAIFEDNTSKGPAVRMFETMMVQMLSMVGVGSAYAVPLKSYLEESGLENVHEKFFEIPYGAACKDQEVAVKSTSCLVASAIGLRDFIKGIYPQCLPLYLERY
jgi:hypothetical protein